jgi:hypothetical protein
MVNLMGLQDIKNQIKINTDTTDMDNYQKLYKFQPKSFLSATSGVIQKLWFSDYLSISQISLNFH